MHTLQLLDEVFLISRILKVEVGVITQITFTMILIPTKNKSNNIIVSLYIDQKNKWKSSFLLLH